MGTNGSIHSGVPNPCIKQVPVIPFGNEQQYMEKHPIVSYGSYLKTEKARYINWSHRRIWNQKIMNQLVSLKALHPVGFQLK